MTGCENNSKDIYEAAKDKAQSQSQDKGDTDTDKSADKGDKKVDKDSDTEEPEDTLVKVDDTDENSGSGSGSETAEVDSNDTADDKSDEDKEQETKPKAESSADDTVEHGDLYEEVMKDLEDESIGGHASWIDAKAPTVTLKDYKVSEDWEGKPVLVVEYEFTNNDDETLSFQFGCTDTVTQGDEECLGMVVGCADLEAISALARSTDVKPGKTEVIKLGYLLNGMGDATITVEDIGGTEVLLSETVKLN